MTSFAEMHPCFYVNLMNLVKDELAADIICLRSNSHLLRFVAYFVAYFCTYVLCCSWAQSILIHVKFQEKDLVPNITYEQLYSCNCPIHSIAFSL